MVLMWYQVLQKRGKTFSLGLLVFNLLLHPGIHLVSLTARMRYWPTFDLMSSRGPWCFSARLQLVGQVRLHQCCLWSLSILMGDLLGLGWFFLMKRSEISMYFHFRSNGDVRVDRKISSCRLWN